MIYYQDVISKYDPPRNPNVAFIFGDNMVKQGYGGQAAALRGWNNSFGFPTKWYPRNSRGSFFKDEDLDEIAPVILEQVKAVHDFRSKPDRGWLVYPAFGIGTGLARLDTSAPAIARYYDEVFWKEFGILRKGTRVRHEGVIDRRNAKMGPR